MGTCPFGRGQRELGDLRRLFTNRRRRGSGSASEPTRRITTRGAGELGTQVDRARCTKKNLDDRRLFRARVFTTSRGLRSRRKSSGRIRRGDRARITNGKK